MATLDRVTAAPDHHAIVIVGMSGVGKSAAGRMLAHRQGRRFVDLDTEIERRAGERITDLFAAGGEAHFRDVESEALEAVLAEPAGLVVSTGGGVVLRGENRDLLATAPATVVWLDAAVTTLESRVGSGTGRPMLAGDVPGRLQSLDDERRQLYAAVAHHVVTTDQRTVNDVVEAITEVVS